MVSLLLNLDATVNTSCYANVHLGTNRFVYVPNRLDETYRLSPPPLWRGGGVDAMFTSVIYSNMLQLFPPAALATVCCVLRERSWNLRALLAHPTLPFPTNSYREIYKTF